MRPALIAASGVWLLFAGCGTARRSEPIVGPRPAYTGTLARGHQAFMQRCHACHPGGEAGIGPSLNNKPFPASVIKLQVRHGLGAMPALKADYLDDADLDAIAAYLIALRKVPVRSP